MDVKFTVDSSDIIYRSANVEVERLWVGKKREMADRTNKIFTDGYYLRFTIESDQIEVFQGMGPVELQNALEDDDVTITINGQTHAVVGDMDSHVIYSTRYGARSNSERIVCITKNLLTKANVKEFERSI